MNRETEFQGLDQEDINDLLSHGWWTKRNMFPDNPYNDSGQLLIHDTEEQPNG